MNIWSSQDKDRIDCDDDLAGEVSYLLHTMVCYTEKFSFTLRRWPP